MSQVFASQRIGGAPVFGPQSGATTAGPGVITSSWLGINNGAPHINAPFTAFVYDPVSGNLILKKTGLTSILATDGLHWVCTFADAAITRGAQYAVQWLRTDTEERGLELLTAA